MRPVAIVCDLRKNLVHFSAPPVPGAEVIDKAGKKSFYYNKLKLKRP